MKNSIFRLPPKYFISYEYGGSDFTGCDCYGFVQLFYREELGINLIDFPRVGTNRTNLPEDYVRNRQSFEFDKVEFPQNYDVAFMFNFSGAPSHVGVFMQNSIIHALEKCGVVVQEARLLKNKIISFHRYRGIK